jgi:hypothetical protein
MNEMELIKELDDLFESKTINPTFTHAHILLSLFIFQQNPKGIGRYRLKEELLIGSGTARSLIEKLKKKIQFIEVLRENEDKLGSNKRKGHVLTKKGVDFLIRFKQKIPILENGDLTVLKEIIIESSGSNYPSVCIVKNGAGKMRYGVEQRDAAIKAYGSGATCLVYNGLNLVFPSSPNIKEENVGTKVQNYFKKIISNSGKKLEKDDVVIIGLGDNPKKARLASLNAALTLI